MVDGGQWWWSIRWWPAELLEKTDVEHIVQPSARRKGQADSDVIDEFDDAVGPEVARLELASDGLGNGRCCSLTKTKEDLIAHLIRNMTVELVVVLLLDRLCLLQAITDVRQELVTLLHVPGDGGHPCVPRLIRPDGWRIAPVDDAERRVPQRGLVGGVVDVLGPWQPAQPLSRSIAGEAAQVHDDDVVGSF